MLMHPHLKRSRVMAGLHQRLLCRFWWDPLHRICRQGTAQPVQLPRVGSEQPQGVQEQSQGCRQETLSRPQSQESECCQGPQGDDARCWVSRLGLGSGAFSRFVLSMHSRHQSKSFSRQKLQGSRNPSKQAGSALVAYGNPALHDPSCVKPHNSWQQCCRLCRAKHCK